MNEALLSSKDMNWCTPVDFFNGLDQEFHFEIDAAATDKSAKCSKYFTPADNGLEQSWGGVPRVLQSAIRQTDRGLGPQRLRRRTKARHSRGYAYSFTHRYAILA